MGTRVLCAICVVGIIGEFSAKIILNLGQWFRVCCLKKKITDDTQQTKSNHINPPLSTWDRNTLCNIFVTSNQ